MEAVPQGILIEPNPDDWRRVEQPFLIGRDSVVRVHGRRSNRDLARPRSDLHKAERDGFA
jgi:hypothetical protein